MKAEATAGSVFTALTSSLLRHGQLSTDQGWGQGTETGPQDTGTDDKGARGLENEASFTNNSYDREEALGGLQGVRQRAELAGSGERRVPSRRT